MAIYKNAPQKRLLKDTSIKQQWLRLGLLVVSRSLHVLCRAAEGTKALAVSRPETRPQWRLLECLRNISLDALSRFRKIM
jgi:hypothetical protein